jgi:hypothetical protein
MLHLAATIVAATIGLLLIVNVFRLAAGVWFTHWRHVLTAYAAGLLFCAVAARGEGQQAIGYLLTAPIAIGLELMLLRRRSPATRGSSPVIREG